MSGSSFPAATNHVDRPTRTGATNAAARLVLGWACPLSCYLYLILADNADIELDCISSKFVSHDLSLSYWKDEAAVDGWCSRLPPELV